MEVFHHQGSLIAESYEPLLRGDRRRLSLGYCTSPKGWCPANLCGEVGFGISDLRKFEDEDHGVCEVSIDTPINYPTDRTASETSDGFQKQAAASGTNK